MNNKTYNELYEDIRQQDKDKITHPNLKVKSLVPYATTSDRGLALPSPVGEVMLATTEWARTQMYQKLGAPFLGGSRALPKDYLEALPYDMWTDLMTFHIGRDTNRWTVSQYQDEARAILSATYPDVRNMAVMEVVQQTLEVTGNAHLPIARYWVTPDNINIELALGEVNLKDGRGDGDDYKVGIAFFNDETGNGGLGVESFLYKLICSNGMRRKIPDVVMRMSHHRSYTPVMMLNQFSHAVGVALNATEEMLERIEWARRQPLDVAKAINGMRSRHKWSIQMSQEVAVGTNGENTISGLIDGITYAAHRQPSDERRIELERMAGDLLFSPAREFERLVNMSQTQVNSYEGTLFEEAVR